MHLTPMFWGCWLATTALSAPLLNHRATEIQSTASRSLNGQLLVPNAHSNSAGKMVVQRRDFVKQRLQDAVTGIPVSAPFLKG
ncbi:MAG: hypothetical protein M1815_003276 [Lichina confinis]|nr:MAG: hypothetical protein M1815_003276 [Lichina confinis]